MQETHNTKISSLRLLVKINIITHIRYQHMSIPFLKWQSSRTQQACNLLLIWMKCYCHTTSIPYRLVGVSAA
jgi:hypothetical protein